MIKEVLLPKLGLTMETGTIISWLKKEGDYVEKGEPLFEVETDKAAPEEHSPLQTWKCSGLNLSNRF